MPITIGGSNVGYEEVLGRHGLFVTCFVMNDNGERFADICAEHELIIGGSVFPHRSVHKAIGSHLTIQRRIRLSTCAHLESSEGHYRMSE